MTDKIKCKCGWIGNENELEYEETHEGRGFSEYALCPKCKIDLS